MDKERFKGIVQQGIKAVEAGTLGILGIKTAQRLVNASGKVMTEFRATTEEGHRMTNQFTTFVEKGKKFIDVLSQNK